MAEPEDTTSPESSMPPWPTGDWTGNTPTMEQVARFWAGLGVGAASMSVDLSGDEFPFLAWRLNCEQVQHAHDVLLLLQELAEVDPARAERAAHRIWLAAEAGDAYGEWLWQWAHERGLDCDAITQEASARVEAERRRLSDAAGEG